MKPDRRVEQTASRQYGYVTFEQCVGCGLSPDQIRWRKKDEGWSQPLPRVLRLPGHPETFEGRLVAAGLWLGDRGHFYGPTAAHILRLRRAGAQEKIEVAMGTGASCGALRVRRITDRPQLRKVCGLKIPATTRVLLECATSLPPRETGACLDDALRRRMVTVQRMNAYLDDTGGRGARGTKTLRALLRSRDKLDEKVRTTFETKMLRILRRCASGGISPDHIFVVRGNTYYVDFYLPHPRLAIECHSLEWHFGEERLESDARRDRDLKSIGVEPLYFTWDEVSFHPESVATEIREAITRRLSS